MNCCRFAFLALALAVGLMVMPGCNKSNKTEAKTATANMSAMNDMCMCGSPVGSKPVYETYNGKNIAFCCADCKAKFDKMTTAQKNEYISKASAATGKVSMGALNDKCPLKGGPVTKSSPTVTYQGKTIGFCCGGCAQTFEAMTDAKKAEVVAKMNTAAK